MNATKLISIEDIQHEAAERSEQAERHADQVISRGSGLAMPFLISSEERKKIRQAALAEMEKGFAYRQKNIEMALDLRLQSFREVCNQILVHGKTALRQERVEYYSQTYAQVERHIEELTREFMQDMDERFENIARFKTERLRERETRRLEKTLDSFLDTCDRLMTQFASILNEEIAAQDAPDAERYLDPRVEELFDEETSGSHRL